MIFFIAILAGLIYFGFKAIFSEPPSDVPFSNGKGSNPFSWFSFALIIYLTLGV
jgi:hypothetical protein